ncbi:hypothetical protein APA76_29005 [Pseudomonas aeruginosa]|nr:hypothetical protein APA76_29005 [Pseudomonas aeruginosa]
MTPHAFARWNLLLLVASIFAGLVFAPSADLSALPTPEDRKWVLAEVPSVAVDTTVAGKLAGMSWWGRTVDEEREAESKRVSVGVDGVALIKVDWLLRGIVRDEGCGFHAIRPPSPLSSGQAFHGHLATCSTAIRPGSRSAATQGGHC